MMSFGGGWFFLAASEAISVLNKNYTLPGVGSYVAAAIAAKNVPALIWAAITIAVVILLVDQLFWRRSWRGRTNSHGAKRGRRAAALVVYDLLRSSIVPGLIERVWRPLGDAVNAFLYKLTAPSQHGEMQHPRRRRSHLHAIVIVVTIALVGVAAQFVVRSVGVVEVLKVVGLGFATLGRVMLLLVVATLVWTRSAWQSDSIRSWHARCSRSCSSSRRSRRTLSSRSRRWRSSRFTFRSTGMHRAHGPRRAMVHPVQHHRRRSEHPTELREMTADLDVKGWLRWRR